MVKLRLEIFYTYAVNSVGAVAISFLYMKLS